MNKHISRKVDCEHLIKMLQHALTLEMNSIYTYFLSRQNIVGELSPSIAHKFKKIMKDEYDHAKKISKRIKELGGDVKVCMKKDEDGKDWIIEKYCSEYLLELNKEKEDEAIDLYFEIIDYTENKDHITCHLFTEIVSDESHHAETLESLLEDISVIKSKK